MTSCIYITSIVSMKSVLYIIGLSNIIFFIQITQEYIYKEHIWLWLGMRDSNPRMAESKSAALPLGEFPEKMKDRTSECPAKRGALPLGEFPMR